MSRRAAFALIVALLALTGGCGGDGEPTTDPTTTAPRTSTTSEPVTATAPPTDEELITQLEEEWWQAVRGIGAGESQSEVARRFLSGRYLDSYLGEQAEAVDDGQISELSTDSSQTVEAVTIDGDEAVVVICVVNADRLIDSRTSEVVDDSIGRRRYTDHVIRTTDGWRIELRQKASQPGEEVMCDAE